MVASLRVDRVTADAVRLAVSELVSNAVMHGTGAIIVTLADEPDGVRISVTDDGRGFSRSGDPAMPPPDSPAAGAWRWWRCSERWASSLVTPRGWCVIPARAQRRGRAQRQVSRGGTTTSRTSATSSSTHDPRAGAVSVRRGLTSRTTPAASTPARGAGPRPRPWILRGEQRDQPPSAPVPTRGCWPGTVGTLISQQIQDPWGLALRLLGPEAAPMSPTTRSRRAGAPLETGPRGLKRQHEVTEDGSRPIGVIDAFQATPRPILRGGRGVTENARGSPHGRCSSSAREELVALAVSVKCREQHMTLAVEVAERSGKAPGRAGRAALERSARSGS